LYFQALLVAVEFVVAAPVVGLLIAVSGSRTNRNRTPMTTYQTAGRAAPPAPRRAQSPRIDANWHHAAFLPLQSAAFILGISPASLYGLEREGRLAFKHLAGRTLVPTADIIALVADAKTWVSAPASTKAARLRRAELAQIRRSERCEVEIVEGANVQRTPLSVAPAARRARCTKRHETNAATEAA